MQIGTSRNMRIDLTDIALLGTSLGAGVIGSLETYGSFLITAGGAILLGVIRWQQHRQQLKNMQLDEEIKRRKLEDLA